MEPFRERKSRENLQIIKDNEKIIEFHSVFQAHEKMENVKFT